MNLYYNKECMLELKTRLRKKFPQLTEVDLSSSTSNEDDMFRMIEYKLGKTKTELKIIIKNL
jgi:hypothetical protein